MPINSVHLVKAQPDDIPIISTLAHAIWHKHYKGVVGDEQIDYMLNLMYTHKSLTEQMTKQGHDFYLIQKSSEIIGFISICKLEAEGSYYIHKYYLSQNLAGQGSGTLAFLELLKLLKPNYFKLTVNRKNFKSINFYFKNGFKIENVADFDIGKGFFMNDFIMVWKRG
jgi:RimJ/RimL family protein N-acetyltransferase